MSFELSTEDLIKKVGNKFLLTTAVARRAIQIKEGDMPLVNRSPMENPVVTALKELQNEKIVMGMTEKEELSRSESIFEEELEDVEEAAEEEKPKKQKKEVKKKKSLTA